MKILGVDYGDARTGLSVSDPTGLIAGSPSVIAEWNRDKLIEKLVSYIRENRIEEIVMGYPRNMDGTVGARAEKCAALAEALANSGPSWIECRIGKDEKVLPMIPAGETVENIIMKD